jgi:hypothetical protein
VTFTPRELALAAHAVRAMVVQRRLWGAPMPAGMAALDERLQRALLISDAGSENPTTAGQLEPSVEDVISTAQAASILRLTPRRVCQLAADLGGRRCGAGYVFNRSEVIEYARLKGVDVESD